jgi:hypothetical protein
VPRLVAEQRPAGPGGGPMIAGNANLDGLDRNQRSNWLARLSCDRSTWRAGLVFVSSENAQAVGLAGTQPPNEPRKEEASMVSRRVP